MTHTPLPAATKLLQAILSRRAVEAMHPAHYYAISDMALGAQYLTDNIVIHDWLEDVIADAAELAALGNHGAST